MGGHRDAWLKPCGRQWLVIASDNSAAIGWAALDELAVDPYLVGRLTARVAALEAMSLGAAPLALSSTLSFDYRSRQGREVTRGILEVMAELGLTSADLTGSCETNFPARVTCLGVTVVGLAERDRLLLGRVQSGDGCYLLGRPLVGRPVLDVWPSLLSPGQMRQLVDWSEVREVLPVGSRGIRREVEGLAAAYRLRFNPLPSPDIGWDASAGPATCALVVGAMGLERRLAAAFGQAVALLGRLEKSE